MKKSVAVIFLFVLAIASGFYQEKLKISINYILEKGQIFPGYYELTPEKKEEFIRENRIDAPFDYYHNHTTVSWLYRLNQRELSIMKWVVTGAFLLWFLFMNILILRLLQVNQGALKLLPILYLALVLISFSIYAGGRVGLNEAHCYAVSRKIIGALQSVIPSLIIWPAARLWDNSKAKYSI